MLRVYHSNRLDVLEALMEFIVERQRLDDPFQAEMVLVQSTGMAQWLQMTLAARFGIAANIEFPLPASFIWDMFVRVLKDIPGESAFSKQSMSWKLMTLLPQHLEEVIMPVLRKWRIFEREDFGPLGEMYREKLAEYLEGLNVKVRKFEASRERALARERAKSA